MRLSDREYLSRVDEHGWVSEAFQDFEFKMTNPRIAFPCVLGVAGFKANQLRYYFVDAGLDTDDAVFELAAALQSYVPIARGFGKNTSLVVFFNETRDLGVEVFERVFWRILNRLHRLDVKAWPKQIPPQPDECMWEFSFAGEPIFVVCNTPSHRDRKSRHAKNFMLTFQPRWVFDGVVGRDAPNSYRIKREIRRRLALFDVVETSPDLGDYAQENNREWKQYFLRETNTYRRGGCPFNSKVTDRSPMVVSTQLVELEEVVGELLPPTGSVEVQYDTPFRAHAEHVHDVDETLHIVQGEICFDYFGNMTRCKPGDRLLLPANTLHASVAGENGCLYVIATRMVVPPSATSSQAGTAGA